MKSRFIVLNKELNRGSLTLVDRVRSIIDSGEIPGSSSVEVVDSIEAIDQVRKSPPGVVEVAIYNGSNSDSLPSRDAAILSIGTSDFHLMDPSDNRPYAVLPSRPSREVLSKAMYAAVLQGSNYLSQKHLVDNGNTVGFFGLGHAAYATVSRLLERNRLGDKQFKVLIADYEGENFDFRVNQIRKRFQDQLERIEVVGLSDLTEAGIIALTAAYSDYNAVKSGEGLPDFGNPRYNMFHQGNALLIKDFFDSIKDSSKSFMPIYMTVTNDSFLSARALYELSAATGRLWKVFSSSELDRKRMFDIVTNEVHRGFLSKRGNLPSWLIGHPRSEFRISGTHSSPLLLSRTSRVFDRFKNQLITLRSAYGIGVREVQRLTDLVQKEADEWVESGFQPDEFAETFVSSIDSIVYGTCSHIGQPVASYDGKVIVNPSIDDVKSGIVRFLTLYTSWATKGFPKSSVDFKAVESRQVSEILDKEDSVYRSIVEDVFGVDNLAHIP